MEKRKPLKTILAATDFSPGAEGAIDWAAHLARAHGARLLLVHAFLPPVPTAVAPEFVALEPAASEEDRVRARRELDGRVQALRGRGLDVEAVIVTGMPGDVVLEVVENRQVDLVVAGTRGLSGLKRIFLGSKAAELIRRCPCPVLTVPPEQAEAHRPVQTILVPTDESDHAERAIVEAARLLAPSGAGAKIHLLHVYRLHPEVVYPWTEPHLAARASERTAEALTRLEAFAEPLRRSGTEVEVHVYDGFPPDVIDDTARRLGVDLIAMGTHGRSGLPRLVLGSVAERVLPGAPCPVLSVHADEGRKTGS